MKIFLQEARNCAVTETTTELSSTSSDTSMQTTSSIEVTTTSIWLSTDTTSDSTEALPTTFTPTVTSTVSDKTLESMESLLGNIFRIIIDEYDTRTDSIIEELQFVNITTSETTTQPHVKFDSELNTV